MFPYVAPPGLGASVIMSQWLAPLAKLYQRVRWWLASPATTSPLSQGGRFPPFTGVKVFTGRPQEKLPHDGEKCGVLVPAGLVLYKTLPDSANQVYAGSTPRGASDCRRSSSA